MNANFWKQGDSIELQCFYRTTSTQTVTVVRYIIMYMAQCYTSMMYVYTGWWEHSWGNVCHLFVLLPSNWYEPLFESVSINFIHDFCSTAYSVSACMYVARLQCRTLLIIIYKCTTDIVFDVLNSCFLQPISPRDILFVLALQWCWRSKKSLGSGWMDRKS